MRGIYYITLVAAATEAPLIVWLVTSKDRVLQFKISNSLWRYPERISCSNSGI